MVELVVTDAREDQPSETFSFWKLPGSRRLCHDGRGLTATFAVGARALRLAWPRGGFDDTQLAYAVPVGSRSVKALQAVAEVVAALERPVADGNDIASLSPSRGGIVHMRALQALDAIEAGATHREIAEVLFGLDLVTQAWHADGDLRAQVRYLVRRGQHLMHGGFRSLVTGTKTLP